MQYTIRDLNVRRKALKMPVDVLVARSGVPRPTVFRILRGNADVVRFGHVEKVAAVLGIPFGEAAIEPQELRMLQALRKARLLARFTQGTMGLEGQALPGDDLAELETDAVRQLLADSGRKLWSE